jgi:hypothetical protein
MKCYVKIGEDNQKVKKINRVVNQTLILNQKVMMSQMMSRWRTCWKKYDGADAPKWNLQVDSFVAQ